MALRRSQQERVVGNPQAEVDAVQLVAGGPAKPEVNAAKCFAFPDRLQDEQTVFHEMSGCCKSEIFLPYHLL